jgi:pimeloyl-ACP methyl ester carboxylesterase
VYFREIGQGSDVPLLLLHGQMVDGGVWDPLLARLGAARRLLVPDLPGYGRSPPLAPWSFSGVRSAIEQSLVDRGIPVVDVLAYSLGTYHALGLALEGRVGVRRLYLLGALPGADPEVQAAFRGYAMMVRQGAELARTFVELALPAAWRRSNLEACEAICAAASRASPATLAVEFDAIAELPDLRPRLGELTCEVCLRVGSEDRSTPPAWSEAMARAIPGARLEVVPGVGHLPLAQDLEGTAASVLAFLRR